jgi:hypothetical protein
MVVVVNIQAGYLLGNLSIYGRIILKLTTEK